MFMSLHTLHTCQSLKLIELNAEAAAGFLKASERESLRQNIICPIPTVSISNSPPAASFRHRSSRCSNRRYGDNHVQVLLRVHLSAGWKIWAGGGGKGQALL
jgi:hypothetical protein